MALQLYPQGSDSMVEGRRHQNQGRTKGPSSIPSPIEAKTVFFCLYRRRFPSETNWLTQVLFKSNKQTLKKQTNENQSSAACDLSPLMQYGLNCKTKYLIGGNQAKNFEQQQLPSENVCFHNTYILCFPPSSFANSISRLSPSRRCLKSVRCLRFSILCRTLVSIEPNT